MGPALFPREKQANSVKKYGLDAISDVKVELARLRP
jgi:hypothetical protein